MMVVPFLPRHLAGLNLDGRDPGAALIRPDDVDLNRLAGLTFLDGTVLACCGITRCDDGSGWAWLFADSAFRRRPVFMVRMLKQWLTWIERLEIADPLHARAARDWAGANRMLSVLGFVHHRRSDDGLYEEWVKHVGS